MIRTQAIYSKTSCNRCPRQKKDKHAPEMNTSQEQRLHNTLEHPSMKAEFS
jgi:hypothetical protein